MDGRPRGLPASPGDIRAYDVRTGQLRWTFHTIPHPGEYGYKTWPKRSVDVQRTAPTTGPGMAVDAKRGIVYVPTGSASADFYGANRVGDNLFANTLLALDAATGKRIWHFQAVKHDIWDRDFPSPPTLVTVERDGKTSMRWRRRPSTASCSCSIAPTASRCSRSSTVAFRRARWKARSRRRHSHSY